MFAETATEVLCRRRDAHENGVSSSTPTANHISSRDLEGPMLESEGALILLGSKSDSLSRLSTTRYVVTKYEEISVLEERGKTVSDLQMKDKGCYLQLSSECSRMMEVQQISCKFANDVLDSQASKHVWNWSTSSETTDIGPVPGERPYSSSVSESGVAVQEPAEQVRQQKYPHNRQMRRQTPGNNQPVFGENVSQGPTSGTFRTASPTKSMTGH
jgi:hypothetical protein